VHCLGMWMISRAANAQPVNEDGLYGRLAGDVDLSLSSSMSFRADAGIGLGVGARALYLSAVGAYAEFDAGLYDHPGARRTLATGVSVRPLFLPRWSYALEDGPAWLDLTLDSVALELGVLWTWSNQHDSRPPGLELALAIQAPLCARAPGAWLGIRGAVQWTAPEMAGTAMLASVPSVLFSVSFAWHWIANAHLVDAGDRLLR
jgi:hypothetical protein